MFNKFVSANVITNHLATPKKLTFLYFKSSNINVHKILCRYLTNLIIIMYIFKSFLRGILSSKNKFILRSSPHSMSTDTREAKYVMMSFTTYETDKVTQTPPVIVMHGMLSSKENWRGQCKKLSKRTNPQRKIIVVDARNHGDSPHNNIHDLFHLVADLKHFVDELGIKQAAMLGHSMGGMAMMLFALKYVRSFT